MLEKTASCRLARVQDTSLAKFGDRTTVVTTFEIEVSPPIVVVDESRQIMWGCFTDFQDCLRVSLRGGETAVIDSVIWRCRELHEFILGTLV
jgi:hypothetical protein